MELRFVLVKGTAENLLFHDVKTRKQLRVGLGKCKHCTRRQKLAQSSMPITEALSHLDRVLQAASSHSFTTGRYPCFWSVLDPDSGSTVYMQPEENWIIFISAHGHWGSVFIHKCSCIWLQPYLWQSTTTGHVQRGLEFLWGISFCGHITRELRLCNHKHK